MQVHLENYEGQDTEAFKVLADGIYSGALAELAPGLQVLSNLIVKTAPDGTRFSFAQVWK